MIKAPPRSRRVTIAEKIHQIPRISTEEVALVKLKGKTGELRNVSAGRRKGSVERRIPEEFAGKIRSYIHTHLISTKGEWHTGRFSRSDLKGFLNDVTTHVTRNWHVIVVDPHSYPVGYYTLHATPKFTEWVKKNHALAPKEADPEYVRVMNLIQHYQKRTNRESGRDWKIYEQIISTLQEKNMRVFIRPLPGFQYKKGHFFKTKKEHPKQMQFQY